MAAGTPASAAAVLLLALATHAAVRPTKPKTGLSFSKLQSSRLHRPFSSREDPRRASLDASSLRRDDIDGVPRASGVMGRKPVLRREVRGIARRTGIVRAKTSVDGDATGKAVGKSADGVHTMATVKEQLKLFWQMSVPYFKEDNSAKMMLATVIALTLLQSGVSVMFSFVSKDFWSALNTRDVPGFANVVSRFGVALLSGVPVAVFYRFQREKLALKWREWMTQRVLALYTANRAFYSLENLQPTGYGNSESQSGMGLDNPDQRISEDVRFFCSVSLSFFITVLTSVIDLASFSAILWSIYPQLFVAIVAYATLGTFVTSYLGRKLAALNFQQLQKEADFRYSLMRLRENAESIAFYGGEKQEEQEAQNRLESLTENVAEVIRQQRNLEFFTTSYRYLIQILPGTIVAPLYFKGAVELGSVSQSYSAFNHILGDLSLIVNQFEDLARFGAGIDRLGEFVEALRAEDKEAARAAFDRMRAAGREKQKEDNNVPDFLALPQAFNDTLTSGISEAVPFAGLVGGGAPKPKPQATETAETDAGKRTNGFVEEAQVVLGEVQALIGAANPASEGETFIKMDSLDTSSPLSLYMDQMSLLTPDRRRSLVQKLSLEVKRGESLLIVGESGTGKSSVLRYCSLGSLREQLKYPGEERWRNSRSKRQSRQYTSEDEELLDILESVNLGNLARKDLASALDVVQDWSSILSLGEQQRLAFGRLLYACPSLAILDEATSALDLETEAAMYTVISQRIPGISVVSVGHRPSLKSFHDKMLRLKQEGNWEMKELLSGVEERAFTNQNM